MILLSALHAPAADSAARWYKGNTHTHTWWSDGDAPPDFVVKWYKDNGYDFLALSDHDILSVGEKWIAVEGRRAQMAEECVKAFGGETMATRQRDGKTEYKLTTLDELRKRFESPGEFLMIQAEEISDSFEGKPVHLNGVNLKELIPPQRGDSIRETMQNNIDAVLAQRKRTGQPMFPHVNHPNYHWAITAEDIMHLRGEQFFEVYNGHPVVNDEGDDTHPSTERMWDMILAARLGRLNLPVMYGVATDDAHSYGPRNIKHANPGRGWVVVRAKSLSANDIVLAMERGEFYASTGVVLEDVRFDGATLAIDIKPSEGVTYKTQFIGTMKDSAETGAVFKTQEGLHASYDLTGDELYVRAKVSSSVKHPYPRVEGEMQVAYVQPVEPR